MSRIGVISDTHGCLPQSARLALTGCNRILHAGDIGAQHVLDDLEMIAPVTAVLGNCDHSGYYTSEGFASKQAFIEIEGVRILMVHRLWDLVAALQTARGKETLEKTVGDGVEHASIAPPDICIHGHTHIPKDMLTNGYRTICPGSPVEPRAQSAPTVATLTIANAKLQNVEFVTL